MARRQRRRGCGRAVDGCAVAGSRVVVGVVGGRVHSLSAPCRLRFRARAGWNATHLRWRGPARSQCAGRGIGHLLAEWRLDHFWGALAYLTLAGSVVAFQRLCLAPRPGAGIACRDLHLRQPGHCSGARVGRARRATQRIHAGCDGADIGSVAAAWRLTAVLRSKIKREGTTDDADPRAWATASSVTRRGGAPGNWVARLLGAPSAAAFPSMCGPAAASPRGRRGSPS